MLLTPDVEKAREMAGELAEAQGQIIRAYRPLPLVAGLGVPGLTVPAGNVGGLPVGVQIIARWFEDERCLSAAEVMERRIGSLLPVEPVD